MIFPRILDKIFIFLLIIFLLCFSKIAIAGESSATIPPAEVKLPAIIPPSVNLNRNSIGCVLPLSGQYADLGEKALDAIFLSAGKFDEKDEASWKVIAEDSRGLPEGIKEAIEHLANTENVITIIAISGTAEAMDAAREAEKWKVPLILITPKEGVTSNGEYVFQHFLTPEQQVRALVRYACADLNYAIFSILYPQDDYGEEMVKIFREEVTRRDGKVTKAISYKKNQTVFSGEISKLMDVVVKAPPKNRKGKAEIKNEIQTDFEVLFIPDSSVRAKTIASQLAFYNVNGFQLLGPSLWHSPDLLKKGVEYLEGSIFVDSFFSYSFYPETNNFVDLYSVTYGREPENIEALAYDTTGIVIGVLDDKEIKTRGQFITALKKMKNYEGATGSIYFDANRVSQKTPFILKVKNGKLEQVK